MARDSMNLVRSLKAALNVEVVPWNGPVAHQLRPKLVEARELRNRP